MSKLLTARIRFSRFVWGPSSVPLSRLHKYTLYMPIDHDIRERRLYCEIEAFGFESASKARRKPGFAPTSAATERVRSTLSRKTRVQPATRERIRREPKYADSR